MKILNLKIRDRDDNIVRDIDFCEEGISFIYGDIQAPENKRATINSLGKTLLIKFIDYIYGANEDTSIVKEVLNGYTLDAIVKYNNKNYRVIRVLGNSEEIFVNNDPPKTLGEYKDFFNIKRSRVSKQILVSRKLSEIGHRKHPNKDDVVDFIYFLGLENLVESIEKIYEFQDSIKVHKQSKQELLKFYDDNIDVKEIDEEIYFIDKEVERLTGELEDISAKIKKIEIADIQTNIVEEFAEKNKLLKSLSGELERLRIERERIEEFLENSNKIDVTSEHILKIYEKAKMEVPELVKKKVADVELFHQKVYEERKEFLGNKIKEINKRMSELKKEINDLSTDINKLGEIISLNEVYEESIALYEKYSKELQELKYKEGKLSQIKALDERIAEEDLKLTAEFENAGKIIKEYNERISEFRDFVYDITKSIYDEDVNSYFDIKIIKKHQKTRPVSIELTLRGDTGEGVNEVRKNIIDYLILKFSDVSDILVQDSACFNGIDPRQVAGMILVAAKIAREKKKQVIIAINKYQLGDYKDIIDMVVENRAIILSENDKLLKFDF
ncbi:DUF2326 domain-containing protein [Acetivibrio clariflavus]|uniref:DUF2326 domain-containing protein n=1 Tax=Acetivibrio clariflavus (strain DSM 19732 / NBRC 101661 / EBR45) TaxID=720554 RepID=G8LSE3_ACECE|nr:DUF2326 domain-containing protein [Acetivibrio clariflavus]AEV67204.1 hypothetical protein Clocl_0480 [Acetivibrio clariflavus DSM 19732]